MCMEDISIGRKTQARQYTVPVTTVSVELVAASPKRIALLISAQGANTATISMNNPAVLNNGIILAGNQIPLDWNIKDEGDIVTRSLSVIATGALNITVIETLLAD